jgi:hypothetical protein
MANGIYCRNSFSIIEKAINDFRTSEDINHSGMKGEAREIFFKSIIEPFIIKEYSIGSGKIVDFENNQSDQSDLIIYNSNIIPPFLFDEMSKKGFFPIESVFYWMEIKSQANSKEIKDCIKKVNSLHKLKYSPETAKEAMGYVTGFFAFSSDLKGPPNDELERFKKEDKNFESDPKINFICILGRGYWYFNSMYKKWIYFPANKDHLEIVGLISGISNTLSNLLYTKPPAKIGPYLINQTDSQLILDLNSIK